MFGGALPATWWFLTQQTVLGLLVVWLLAAILEVWLVKDQSGLYHGRSLRLQMVRSVFHHGEISIEILYWCRSINITI